MSWVERSGTEVLIPELAPKSPPVFAFGNTRCQDTDHFDQLHQGVLFHFRKLGVIFEDLFDEFGQVEVGIVRVILVGQQTLLVPGKRLKIFAKKHSLFGGFEFGPFGVRYRALDPTIPIGNAYFAGVMQALLQFDPAHRPSVRCRPSQVQRQIPNRWRCQRAPSQHERPCLIGIGQNPSDSRWRDPLGYPLLDEFKSFIQLFGHPHATAGFETGFAV